jgi:hypothetical protein
LHVGTCCPADSYSGRRRRGSCTPNASGRRNVLVLKRRGRSSSAHQSGRAIDFYLGGSNSSANVEAP